MDSYLRTLHRDPFDDDSENDSKRAPVPSAVLRDRLMGGWVGRCVFQYCI